MIITISRGSFSGGTVLAECVAEQLGYRLVSREILAAAAARYGVTEEKLAQALERAPGLWERLGRDRQLYVVYIQAALCEFLQEDNVVYHGHAGHLLLRGITHVLRVRLIAPMDYRIGAAMASLRCGREEAEAHVRRVDEERARWTRFLYDIDWNSPLLYDLVINLEGMSVETACGVVRATASQPEFQPTVASRKALRDLTLACRVRAALARNEATARLEVEVAADDGVVTLQGNLRDEEQATTVQTIVGQVSGVAAVRPDRLGRWRFQP
ncbi:MAG: cytidylate kinase family protein [Deltaproteobacteria bacterium]|nr:cytidylate kinase family protein [Deltaproteobacteria bacterium]